MKLTKPPELCYALIFGLEHYAAADWHLPGTARDALGFARWLLIDRKVPPANVRIYLSRDATGKLPAFADADGGPQGQLIRQCIRDESPNQNVVTDALSYPFAGEPIANAALIVYWSGHGIVGELEQERTLYTADAQERLAYSVNISRHARGLRFTQPADGFTEQVIIVDACAQWSSTSVDPRWSQVPAPSQQQLMRRDIGQFSLYATEPGQLAETRLETGGYFTKALLERLPKNAWPDDWVKLAIDLQNDFRNSGQVPAYHYIDPSDNTGSPRASARVSKKATELARIVQSTTAIPLSKLQSMLLNAAASANFRRPRSVAEGIEWLDQRIGEDERSGLGALDRFGVELELEYETREQGGAAGDARATAELKSAREALTKWLDTWPGVSSKLELAEERRRVRAQRPDIGYLVVDIPGEGPEDAIRAWLLAQNGDIAARFRGEIRGNLRTALSEVLSWAMQKRVASELVWELWLPPELLTRGIEQWEIDAPDVEDVRQLGQDFITFLRFRGRATKTQLEQEWRAAWARVRRELDEAGGEHRVTWVPAPPAHQGVISSKQWLWLGFSFLPYQGALPRSALMYALSRGAPLILWPIEADGAPPPDQQACAEVEELLKNSTLDNLAPNIRAALAKRPMRFRLLVDSPDRFPDPSSTGGALLAQPAQR